MLFAVHPLRVESVAWAAERKDLLFFLFGLLAILAYWSYVRRRTVASYLLVSIAYVFSLMSKPMLVSLPLLFLLLDFWPLGRFDDGCEKSSCGKFFKFIVLEKIPLAIISAVFCVIAVAAQRRAGAVVGIDALPVWDRLMNAPVSYASYIWKTLWPTGLAVFYPHPHALGQSQAWASLATTAVLAVFTYAAFRWRRFAYVPVGWFWFLISLFPVIGLVQVDVHARADRFTYFPSVGLAILMVWGCFDLCAKKPVLKKAGVAVFTVALLLLATASRIQAGYWKNSEALWTRAISVTDQNWIAHFNLGLAYYRERQAAEALDEYDDVLAIMPNDGEALLYSGMALGQLGRVAEALARFERAMQSDPNNPLVHYNAGFALEQLGRPAEAEIQYREALRFDPDLPPAKERLKALRGN